MCCSDYSAQYLYPTFRLAANEGGKSLAETQGGGATSPEHRGPSPCEETALMQRGTYHTSPRCWFGKRREKMMAKTDSDAFPNTLGEDLFRRGQKKCIK